MFELRATTKGLPLVTMMKAPPTSWTVLTKIETKKTSMERASSTS